MNYYRKALARYMRRLELSQPPTKRSRLADDSSNMELDDN